MAEPRPRMWTQEASLPAKIRFVTPGAAEQWDLVLEQPAAILSNLLDWNRDIEKTTGYQQ
jgi:hypothetical protein